MKTRITARPLAPALPGGRSATVVVGLLLLAAGSAQAVANHLTITTELQEVRRASVNGRDYLTIRIPHSIGPRSCHGTVLTVDTAALPSENGRNRVETDALEAMLTAESVMITVPTASDQCIDGKPTVTDLYRLPTTTNGSS